MVVLATPPVLPSRARSRVTPPAPVLLGAAAAVIGYAGAWIPSYWGDEAASVMSATRSWPSLVAELTTIDGVHGLYYALLHLWVSIAGPSEAATRLPSALAVGAMVAGVVVLTRAFAGPRVAVLAGVVAILLPRATAMAIEARSSALAAAVAVWITVLLVTLVRRPRSRSAWVAYGVALGIGMTLFLYLGLLLVVHAAFLVVSHRDAVRPWLRGAGVALLVGLPVLVIGYLQREQIHFLVHRDYANPGNVLVNQWFGNPRVAIAAGVVILALVVWTIVTRRRGILPGRLGELLVLGFAWLLLPTTLLLIGNVTLSPMYNVRYLAFCTPAVAILLALGITVIARTLRARGRGRIVVAGILTAVLAGLALPSYVAERGAFAKDGGADFRQVAEYIGANAASGEAIVWDQTTKPSRSPRIALDLYPGSFSAVRDVELVTPYDETSGLWDHVNPISAVRGDLLASSGVWAVELAHGSALPPDVTALQHLGFVIESTTRIHRTTIYHLVQE